MFDNAYYKEVEISYPKVSFTDNFQKCYKIVRLVNPGLGISIFKYRYTEIPKLFSVNFWIPKYWNSSQANFGIKPNYRNSIEANFGIIPNYRNSIKANFGLSEIDCETLYAITCFASAPTHTYK